VLQTRIELERHVPDEFVADEPSGVLAAGDMWGRVQRPPASGCSV
jgi:hypothetical protein